MVQMSRVLVLPLLAFNAMGSEAERVEGMALPQQPGQGTDMSTTQVLKLLAEAVRYPMHMARMGTNDISDVFCTPVPEQFSKGPLHPDARHRCVEPIEYPATGDRTYVSYEAVEELLMDTPLAQAAGIVTRGNELGYFHLGPEFWKHEETEDERKIGLGASADTHEMLRPVLDRVLAGDGMWTEQELEQSVFRWMEEMWWPREIEEISASDISKWTTNELHKLHLGDALEKSKVDEFLVFQKTVLGVSVMQGITQASSGLLDALSRFDGSKDIAGGRKYWIEGYEQLLKGKPLQVIQEAFHQQQVLDQYKFKTFILKAFLESLLFAGGLSVPTIIQNGLAVLHSAHSPLAGMTEKERLRLLATEDGLDQFIFEVIRKYPAVYGFPVYRTVGWAAEPKHFIGNVAMALRDPEVFESPLNFNPQRDVTLMRQKIGMAWAEPANGKEAWHTVQENPSAWGKTPQSMTPDSHGCPGERLSYTMVKAFFKKWIELRSAVEGFGVVLEVVPESDAPFTDHIGFTPSLKFRKVQAPPARRRPDDRPGRGVRRMAEDMEEDKDIPSPKRARDDD